MRVKAGFGPEYRARIKGAPDDFVAITDGDVMKRFVDLELDGYRVAQMMDGGVEILAIVFNKNRVAVQIEYDPKAADTPQLKRLLDAFDLWTMPADDSKH